jgi:hypothetical protein
LKGLKNEKTINDCGSNRDNKMYTIGEKERYCDMHCHNEELLIQEERLYEKLNVEQERLGAEWPDLT